MRISLGWTSAEIMRAMERCDGILLPGSKADVDPAKFNAARSPHTAEMDSARESVDELLLDEAYRLRKPVLGICYGLQSLNVYRGGSLVQHIPEFLPQATRDKVNHEAGKKVAIAHDAEIDAESTLGRIVGREWNCGAGCRAGEFVAPSVSRKRWRGVENCGALSGRRDY